MPTYLASDGTKLHYDESGAGRTLVVLAGGAAMHPRYLGDLAGLPGHLLFVHLRGVGDSPAPASPETGSYWNQAHDLEDLRRHLGVAGLDIVGHSAGTRLAMAYAARYPDSVASMLLITPPSGHLTDTPSDAEDIAAHRRGEPAFDKAVAAMSRTVTTQAEYDAWRADTAPVGYAAWNEQTQAHARMCAANFDAVRAYFSVTPPEDFPQLVGRTQAKVRVIAGAQDFSTGLAPVLAAAKLFANGEAVVIDDCGHFPWVEQPAAFRRAADPFVA